MISIIESVDNKTFKIFKSYLNKKNRQKNKIFMAEGLKVIKEAIDYKNPVDIAISDRIYKNQEVVEIIDKLKDTTNIYIISEKIFNLLTDTEHPQGIVAYFSFLHKENIQNIEDGHYIYIDDIKDPGNLGGIIRSAEAFNIKGVILSKETVDLYNPKVVRTTMASIFREPIYIINKKEELLNVKNRFLVISAAFENSVDSDVFDYKKNIILAIGNEAHGVSNEIINMSDYIVKIPMSRVINSLNANVAASILMYEMDCSTRK